MKQSLYIIGNMEQPFQDRLKKAESEQKVRIGKKFDIIIVGDKKTAGIVTQIFNEIQALSIEDLSDLDSFFEKE